MANVPITVAVVLLGFIKGRMIIRYFMEVRTAPAMAEDHHRRLAHRAVGGDPGDLSVVNPRTRQHRPPELEPCFNQPHLGTGHRDARTRDASSYTATPSTGRRSPFWTGLLCHGRNRNEDRKTHTSTAERNRRECCPAEIGAQRRKGLNKSKINGFGLESES